AAAVLGVNTTLTGAGAFFTGVLDDATLNTHDLTVHGGAGFAGPVGGLLGLTALHSLHVTGATAINTTVITTGTTQNYDGPVTLGSNASLTGTNLTFGSTVNSFDSTPPRALTLTAGGNVAVTG